MKKTLKEWRKIRAFFVSQGVSPDCLVGLSWEAWAEMLSLAEQWEAAQEQMAPEVLDALRAKAKEEAEREREANLFYSCGAFPGDGGPEP